jgi:hypothetical protein
MLSGDDTRNLAHAPTFVNVAKVTVRPGESGSVSFDVFNYYADTIHSARVTLEFKVGGDWINARPVSNLTSPPKFDPSTPVNPVDIAPGSSMHVTQKFTTDPRTPVGPYLVSVVLTFTYLNPSGVPSTAIFKSLGALSSVERGMVNMSNYTQTVDALGLDGVAPDTSVVVDGGNATMLFWAAAGFGVAVVAGGTAIGMYRSRRGRPRRRK